MKDFVKHIKAFSEFDVDGLADGSVVMAVVSQGTARLAMQRNKKLKYVIPRPCEQALGRHVRDPDKGAATSMRRMRSSTSSCSPRGRCETSTYIGYPTSLPGISKQVAG